GRGRVPADNVLARRQPRAHRPREGSTRAVRAIAQFAERRRDLLRRVRHEGEAQHRQLPAGVLAPRVHRVGITPVGVAPIATRHPREGERLTMASDHYDIVIIGSGAGGGTLAWKLAPTGLRVLLLERGDFLPRERDNWDSDAVFLRSKYTTNDTWKTA